VVLRLLWDLMACNFFKDFKIYEPMAEAIIVTVPFNLLSCGWLQVEIWLRCIQKPIGYCVIKEYQIAIRSDRLGN
jgi:hypothetical protein